MPTNDFLPVASAGGANVMSQSDYLAEAARTAGVTAGTAKSALANKSWRQSAAMAAMIGQFINDIGNLNALDDGNIANLEANFISALRIIARKPTVTKFTASGTFTATVAGPHKFYLWGAGGGGGYGGANLAGSGGSPGAYAEIVLLLSVGDVVNVVIGAGGAGGLGSGANGGKGGDSSITVNATTYTVGGGPGGLTNITSGGTNSPSSATVTGPFDRILVGAVGDPGRLMNSPAADGGRGGSAPLGGAGGVGGGGAGSPGSAPGGAGGGSANNQATSPNVGGRGEIWVER